jgi:two-component system sensor histidine kinase KdpD
MTQKDFITPDSDYPTAAYRYALSAVIVIACTVCALLFRHLIEPVNLVMIYLVGVVFIGAHYGRGPSIVASLLAVGAFNFFFVEPYYSFGVYNEKYYITFAFMLGASLIVSSVAAKLRLQSENVSQQNAQLQGLYEAASAFASCREHRIIAETAIHQIESVLPAKVSIWLPDAQDSVHPLLLSQGAPNEVEAATWAYKHDEICGKSTQTLPAAGGYYVPLMAQGKPVGVMGLALKQPDMHQPLITAYASLIASAIARADATHIAEEQTMEAEREKLRNTLLSAVGHDLRTPLASITGAASTLCAQPQLAPQAAELAHSIHGEASRLNRLVHNLLDVTRMESGALSLNRQPYFVNELIGSALQRCKESIGKHSLGLQVAKDLPLLSIDGVLIEQVLINLLENAARYTPEAGSLSVAATQTPYAVEISITDSGIGIPAGSETTIFERYKRLSEKKTEGMGLGLAICKGIVEAHGGHIWARNKKEGGAIFTFTLPFQYNKVTLPEEAA